MIAWKLLRKRRDGTLGPLFINKKMRIAVGEQLIAECHPTKSFQVRKGFHVLAKPEAPHLMRKDGSLALDRIWMKVEIEDYKEFRRPVSQGGVWYLAQKMKVIGPV